MSAARARPTRPASPARPDARHAEETPQAWHDADGESPLAALVDAAVDARELDARTVAEQMGMTPAAFRGALAAADRLDRDDLDRLATVLGVDRAAVRAAAQRGSVPGAPEPETSDAGRPSGAPDAPPEARADEQRADARTAPEPAADGVHDVAMGALLERTVAAIADDTLGRRVRLAVLATAQTAAAEAGRAAPAELSALRRRVLRGGVPWVGEGAVVLDERGGAADDEVVAAAAALVRDVQRAHAGYADLFAPVDDDALAELLRRLTVVERAGALGATSACVVTPPLYGRYLLVCSADATADQRRVALRRGVAHVLAGHVGEVAPLPLPAPPAAERLADLFALADLVPFWQVDHWHRRARLGWRAVAGQIARTARALAGDWADERADDRAMLRVRLYRAHGL